jgi:hypothetical protein
MRFAPSAPTVIRSLAAAQNPGKELKFLDLQFQADSSDDGMTGGMAADDEMEEDEVEQERGENDNNSMNISELNLSRESNEELTTSPAQQNRFPQQQPLQSALFPSIPSLEAQQLGQQQSGGVGVSQLALDLFGRSSQTLGQYPLQGNQLSIGGQQQPFQPQQFLKGLVAVCHSFLHIFLFIQYSRYIHTSFIHTHSLRPISMSSQLSAQWANPPWGAETRFELGLPYSKPARYQLSHAAPLVHQQLQQQALLPQQMMFKVGGKAGGFDLYRGFGEGNSAQFGFGDRIQAAHTAAALPSGRVSPAPPAPPPTQTATVATAPGVGNYDHPGRRCLCGYISCTCGARERIWSLRCSR